MPPYMVSMFRCTCVSKCGALVIQTGAGRGFRLLLNAGADLNLRSNIEVESTPLHSATRYPIW